MITNFDEKDRDTRKLRIIQVLFISPYIHFDPMTASGNVALVKELARCASKIAEVTVVAKREYPNLI